MAPRKNNKSKPGPKKPAKTLSQRFAASAIDKMSEYAVLALKNRLGLNTEHKYVDTNGTTTVTGTLVNRIGSATIPQGDGVNARNGNSVRITSAELRIDAMPAAAATAPTTIRVIVVRFLQPTGPVNTDILQVATDITSPLDAFISEHGIEILDDFLMRVPTVGGGVGAYVSKTYTGLDWQMVWTEADTAGSPANLITGGITTWWMGNSISTAPVMTSTMRLNYVDN